MMMMMMIIYYDDDKEDIKGVGGGSSRTEIQISIQRSSSGLLTNLLVE